MNGKLALTFPYLCALLVVGMIAWEHLPLGMTRHANQNAVVAAESTVRAQTDPVCHMTVGGSLSAAYASANYFFCTERCRDLFLASPEEYVTDACVVCRTQGIFTPLTRDAYPTATWQGKSYGFCTEAHRAAFRSDPSGYFMHTMWGIPGWLYYVSIAFVLIVSFVVFERRSSNAQDSSTANNLPGVRAQRLSRPRVNLLNRNGLRGALMHPATRFALRAAMVAMFVFIVAAGLFGNQLPSKNIAPLLTWTVWWGGLIVLILYAGPAWCYVCPWDAISDWAEGMRLWGRKREGLSLGLKWPKALRSIWPATIMLIFFTWLELGFGVTLSPRATAWLALTILGMAFVCAFLFEKRAFCRYACLVGRIIGLYSLFAPVEVRTKDPQACSTCGTQSCYKGNSQGEACPTGQYLPGMEQNTNCINCMECLKSCEKGNVALQLRPWGEDLVAHHRPRADEAFLAILMLSLTGFHGLTMTGNWQRMTDWFVAATGVDQITAFSAGMLALMIGPGLIYALLVALSRWLARERVHGYKAYFIRYAYALLPIAIFYHIAHNSEHLLMEGQKVLTLVSDPFGWEWNLFGTTDWTLPPLVSLPSLWLIQVFLVMVGHVYSLWVARHVAGSFFSGGKGAFRSQVPMLAAMILFSVLSLWLLKQPMQMRASVM